MTRPNRYPYTKNQWEEETTLQYADESIYSKITVKYNRITGAIDANLKRW